MSDWLERQWRDIRGNVKFAVLSVAGTALAGILIPTMGVITRTVAPWRPFAIEGLFAIVVIWAVVATVTRRAPSAPAAERVPEPVTILNIPLGSYREVRVGRPLLQTKVRVELIEIAERPKPSSTEDSTLSRCVRLGIDGAFPHTAGDAWEEAFTRAKGFQVVLFEFGYLPILPSLAFSFNPREDGFSFFALVVEHIDAAAKTVELRIYQADV